MIQKAGNRCANLGTSNYDFVAMSFQELMEKPKDFFKCKFDHVIMVEVCMYINDSALRECFEKLEHLLDRHCVIYFCESVAEETRLTLDQFFSDSLKTKYSSIYRTPNEYNEYYKLLTCNGFKVIEQAYMPSAKQFAETNNWYTLIER